MRLQRKTLGLLLVTGLVGLLLVGTTAGAQVPEPVYSDYGQLDLVLESGNDAFEFTPTGAADPTDIEALSSNNKCKLKEDGPADLVKIEATGKPNRSNTLPYAGLKDHKIGVRARGEGTGTPCVRIDGGTASAFPQTLTIELGSFFGSNQYADYAQFGLKLKFGASVTVTALNGSNPVDSWTDVCSGSDCGPDSGGDRLLATLDPADPADVFDRIVINVNSPLDGAVTLLDAPSDSAPNVPGETLDTYFNIVEVFDGVINCGDMQAVPGETEIDANGTFIRLNNADNPDVQCDQLKGVNFEAVATEVEFAPAEGATPFNGRYAGRIDFPPRPDAAGPFTLKYDPAGGTAFDDSLACEWADNDDPPDGPDPLPSDLNEALDDLGFHDELAPLLPFDVEPPGFDPQSPTETWCTIGLRSLTQGDGTVLDTFWVFGFGDPRWGGF